MATKKNGNGSKAPTPNVTPTPDVSPMQALIAKRKAGIVSVLEFVEGLEEGLKRKWDAVAAVLQKKRLVREQDLAGLAKPFKVPTTPKMKAHRIVNAVRGVLGEFVEWEVLSAMKVDDGTTAYFANLPTFYAPVELMGIVPESVAAIVRDRFTEVPQRFDVLTDGLEKLVGDHLIETMLDYYMQKGVVEATRKGYKLSKLGSVYGVDAQSIRTLDAIALENQLALSEEQSAPGPASLVEAEEVLRRDIENKTIKPVDVSDLDGQDLKLLFVCEPLFGNQFSDLKLLNWVLPRVHPDITVASGLVQGTFTGYRVDKSRVLSGEGHLNKIGPQFQLAGNLNDALEKATSRLVVNVSSDDDWDLAQSYARLAQLAEGKVWSHGASTRDLGSELKRRLTIIEWYRKWQIQWEYIIPYQYRIKRSLYNANEVLERIGVKKSEYRLIIEILVAKRNGFTYPAKYEDVVNVAALFGDEGKRVVTPDSAIIKIGEREIQFVHNANFSNITQYVDSLLPIEKVMRNLGARGESLPWIIADGTQERFYATYLQGHWIMNLPGLQNPLVSSRHRMKEFNTRILSSKSHRQNTFRKEPASPGVVEMEALADGRLRFKVWNNAVRKVLEEQASMPEEREVLCMLTDLQHGSITMWPEYELKYMDYALFERKASRLYQNGDIIHGTIYPQHWPENRPIRLTSVDSQQRFTLAVQMPLILDAPNLRDFAAWLGNHEWGIWGAGLAGYNPLHFLEAYLQGYMEGRKKSDRVSRLLRAMTVSRVRFLKTHNPAGDVINWPYFSDVAAGFKFAIAHMWQPYGGGRTPVDQQRKWLSNMATSCGDIHAMFGGDKHSVWMAQEADKLLVQMAASAGQSGYELARGLMSTVLYTLVEFSNRDGITVEFVPWQFLDQYQCQSPALKGKDKLLLRPKRGTRAYDQGRMAPYIEDLIVDVTRYMEV